MKKFFEAMIEALRVVVVGVEAFEELFNVKSTKSEDDKSPPAAA